MTDSQSESQQISTFPINYIKYCAGLTTQFSLQDVPDQRSLEYPKLYEPGQLNLLFNKREFFICIAQGIYTSVVLFFVPYAVLSDATQSTGVPLADYQTFAVTTATALVIVVSVQVSGAGLLFVGSVCSMHH